MCVNIKRMKNKTKGLRKHYEENVSAIFSSYITLLLSQHAADPAQVTIRCFTFVVLSNCELTNKQILSKKVACKRCGSVSRDSAVSDNDNFSTWRQSNQSIRQYRRFLCISSLTWITSLSTALLLFGWNYISYIFYVIEWCCCNWIKQRSKRRRYWFIDIAGWCIGISYFKKKNVFE